MFHVVSAREGPDDDLAFRACPPPDDRPPAVHRGVPGYEHNPEIARGADQEGPLFHMFILLFTGKLTT